MSIQSTEAIVDNDSSLGSRKPREADLKRARALVKRLGRISIPHLQCHLGIGYVYAEQLADILRKQMSISGSGRNKGLPQ